MVISRGRPFCCEWPRVGTIDSALPSLRLTVLSRIYGMLGFVCLSSRQWWWVEWKKKTDGSEQESLPSQRRSTFSRVPIPAETPSRRSRFFPFSSRTFVGSMGRAVFQQQRTFHAEDRRSGHQSSDSSHMSGAGGRPTMRWKRSTTPVGAPGPSPGSAAKP